MRAVYAHAWNRAWREFLLSLRSSQDQTFYLIGALVALGFLWTGRDRDVAGLDIAYASVAMPAILTMIAAMGFTMGPMFAIAQEREDGTVLRMRNAPRGLSVYLTAQVFLNILGAVPMLVVLIVPAVGFLGAQSAHGAVGWIAAAGFLVLGAVVLLSLGIALGCLVPDARRAATWGLIPVVLMMVVSGVFNPVQNLWGWLQPIAQSLPLYWLGHGMRWSLLPDEAASVEVGGQWHPVAAVAVLAVWAVASVIAARLALRHVAAHQSGSAVARARDDVAQAAVR
ncbi:MAG: ABC transporter permease [Demequina sp.]|uniref:ABC transporter permease n=1 Tax=Demequina sp. TaxID=2050685 RepID=UPI003A85FE38